ncbi:hypothetical protein C7475_1011231 [Chitinophaga sp. S165]|nr:hypothetical protein C7475_1011231 [Chitinophaga sp. S165]
MGIITPNGQGTDNYYKSEIITSGYRILRMVIFFSNRSAATLYPQRTTDEHNSTS